MANFAQLEIIGPGGSVEFHALDKPQGVINIGRHTDNDVVINSPNVAPFHAVIDYRQWPCQIILLSEKGETTLEGHPLVANIPTAMDNWNTIKVDGYDIILVQGTGGARPPQPTGAPIVAPPPQMQQMTVISAPAAAQAAAPPLPPLAPQTDIPASMPIESIPVGIGPEQSDDYIAIELTEDTWQVNVEQTASTQLTIINGGDRVASFYVSVEGVSNDWVYIESQQVNLFEGDRAVISIMITPPRAPTSLAGQHPVAIVVTSPTYPGHFARQVATLTINPYYEFAVGEMSPKVLALAWTKPEGAVTVPIKNNGNSVTPFVIDAVDDERACSFEFEVPGEEAILAMRAGISLPPGGSQTIPIVVTPPRRLIALRKRTHSFTITTALQQGDQTPRSLMGRATMRPLFGFVHIALFIIAVLALTTFLFMPNQSPQLSASLSSTQSYMQEVEVGFNAYRFPRRKPGNVFNVLNAAALKGTIEYKPDSEIDWELLHTPDDPQGIVPHVPTANGKYRVRADTWVSNLLPMLRGETERRITVPPVPPRIVLFRANPNTIDVGESVTVTWVISDAETVTLDLGEGPESIEETTSGSRQVSLEQSTTFALKVGNIFGEVTQPETVNVRPTPTPPPPPRINAFSAKPAELVRGEQTQSALSWDVTTFAGDTEIELSVLGGAPIGVGLAAKDTMTVPVADTTVFMLSASQGENVDTRQAMITVLDPTPTPTPLPPEPPEIQLFSGTPNEVVAGDSQVVKLQWRVVGDVTNVEITAPNLKLTGLKPQDASGLDVTVNETTLFVLTAYNDNVSSSQPLEIKAIDPTPTPTPVPPPPIIHFFTARAIGNPNDVTQQSTTTTTDGTTIVYNVIAGTQVELNWLVEGQDTLILTGPSLNEGVAQQGPRLIGTVTTDATYQLMASNNGGVTTDIVVLRVQLVPPPAPYNVDGAPDYAGNTITITWDYDQASFDKVYFTGFRIYSADVSPGSTDTSFYEVGMVLKGVDPIPPYVYVHAIAAPGSAYGRAYYVTAVYQDVLQGVEKETGASRNSWYSQPTP
jgi:hypothetical protein